MPEHLSIEFRVFITRTACGSPFRDLRALRYSKIKKEILIIIHHAQKHTHLLTGYQKVIYESMLGSGDLTMGF